MTTKVTKESLAENIGRLQDIKDNTTIGLSLREEYQLEAYRMLLALLEKEDGKR